jgi:hypothetical protein
MQNTISLKIQREKRRRKTRAEMARSALSLGSTILVGPEEDHCTMKISFKKCFDFKNKQDINADLRDLGRS